METHASKNNSSFDFTMGEVYELFDFFYVRQHLGNLRNK